MAAEQPQFINTYRSEVCSSAKVLIIAFPESQTF